jgi:hypothetical protein
MWGGGALILKASIGVGRFEPKEGRSHQTAIDFLVRPGHHIAVATNDIN